MDDSWKSETPTDPNMLKMDPPGPEAPVSIVDRKDTLLETVLREMPKEGGGTDVPTLTSLISTMTTHPP